GGGGSEEPTTPSAPAPGATAGAPARGRDLPIPGGPNTLAPPATAIDRPAHDGVKRRHLPAPTHKTGLIAANQAIAWRDREQPPRAHWFVGPFDVHQLRLRAQHAVLDQLRGGLRQH